MKNNDRMRVLARVILCATVVGPIGTSLADIGPPVAIKILANPAVAFSGQEYEGAFEIHVYQSGDLTDFQIEGEGWNVASSTLPKASLPAAAGTITITFKAKPTDADKSVGLSFRYNGRYVRTFFNVGPARAARKAQPRLLTRVPNTTGLRSFKGAESEASVKSNASVQGDVVPIRVVGRIVYDRAGIDRSDPLDGDFNDPEDTPPVTVGADRMRVALLDVDTIADEFIWLGTTDEQGYFDSGVVMWDDCHVNPLPPFNRDCDVPDLLLKASTYSPDIATVADTNDDVYLYIVPEMVDFGGEFHDYGVLRPSAADMPAIHLLNNAVRATRFVLDEGASQNDHVRIIWPDDSRGDTAWFTPGEDAIHVSTDRQWRTDTIIHEFGHHHMNLFYNPVPVPNYCDAEADCDDNPPTVCGHCRWCDENASVAWFEGWPNWLVDVVTRDYPNRYAFDDGTPYEALYTRSHESPGACNGTFANPLTTEGFVSALLRDIEDATQDDHDDDPDPQVTSRDGVFDLLCLGVDEIFQIMENRQPLTVTEFIDDFLAVYPQHTGNLWSTAVNVGGGAYVTSFPIDIDPPAAVTTCDSPTHPIGTGDGRSCVTLEWDPAIDDATGANAYSYFLHQNPAGVEPDEEADPVTLTDHCKLSADTVAWELGNWYFSIKARDNWGKWSTTATFGPFEITDCNNTGLLDMCDIDCEHTGRPGGGICEFVLSPCIGLAGCGISEDCNENLKPDECDIGEGESEDCDLNSVPDECQAMKHWTGEVESPNTTDWGSPANWAEREIPALYDVACLPADTPPSVVFYTEGHAHLTSLASWKDFRINGPATIWPEKLELDLNSFVLGDMTIQGNSTLSVYERLYVDDQLLWHDGTINGGGVTEVANGLRLTWQSVDLVSGTLKLTGGESYAHDARITLYSGADIIIRPSATYWYQGDSYLFNGTSGLIDLDGTLVRETGTGTATINTPVDNSGTVHVQTGELHLAWGGTHTGSLVGDAGTKLRLRGVHELLASSSLELETLKLDSSNGSNIRGSVNITDTLELFQGTWTFQPEADIISYGTDLVGTNGRHYFLAPTDAPIDFNTVTIGPAPEGSLSVYFDTGLPVNIGDLDLNKGLIYGSSPINILNTLTWKSDGFSRGGTVIANAPVTLEAGGGRRFLDRTFNNLQTTTMLGGGLDLAGPGSTRWNNMPGSLFHIQANSVSITGRTFENASTILRSSGDGNALIRSAVENSGIIRNQTGTMSLAGGGVHSGELRCDPGTLLQLTGSHEFLPGSLLVAEDIALFNSNDATFRGTVNISESMLVDSGIWTFTNEADIIDYGDHLNIVRGSVHFEAPTDRAINFDTVTIELHFNSFSLYFDTGQAVNINTLTMGNQGDLFGSSSINIADQFTWSAGNIRSGGAIRCDGITTINPGIGNARTLSRPLNNYGEMTIRGQFSTAPSGPITNMPGATIDLQYENSSLGLSGVINNDGTMIKSTSAGVAGLPNVVNTGTIDVQIGGISFHTVYVGFTQTAGETILNDTSIEMLFGHKPFELQGGLLRGNGSVIGEVSNSGGTVTPGFSVGEIVVDDYTQGAGAMLDIEIGGANVGEFDVLTVTGTATLSGELRVTDIAPFVPQVGHSFVILTAAVVAGTFDTETVPDHYEVVYSTTDVTVQIASPSPDLNGDGLIDLKDVALFQVCYAGSGQPSSANCATNVNADLDVDGDVDLDDYKLLFVAMIQ